MMTHVTIGKIQKPFGVKGELKILPTTDFVKERFKKGTQIIVQVDGQHTSYEIASVRRHQQSLLIRLVGIDDLDQAQKFYGGQLLIPYDQLHTLPENQYYFVDLETCDVYVDDVKLGKVVEVMDMPAHPVLKVQTPERDILIPFVASFIAHVDLEQQRIDVNWMEGL